MKPSSNWSTADIIATVRRYWGYSELRPLQEQAIGAGLEQRRLAGGHAHRGRQIAVLPGPGGCPNGPGRGRLPSDLVDEGSSRRAARMRLSGGGSIHRHVCAGDP